MKKATSVISLVLAILLGNIPQSVSQQGTILENDSTTSLQVVLHDALRCIKMTPKDLTFRNDYVDVDSFRLSLVDSFMHKPLDIVSFNNSVRQDFNEAILSSELDLVPFFARYLQTESTKNLPLNRQAGDFTVDLKENRFLNNYSEELEELPSPLKNSLCHLFEGLYLADSLTLEAFADLSTEERDFLRDNFPVIALEDVSDEFKTPEEIEEQSEHEEKLTKEMVPYLEKIEREKIYEAGIRLSAATKVALSILRDYLEGAPQVESIAEDKRDVENDVIFKLDTYLGKIIIGGIGSTDYRGTFAVIIDLGGDDLYSLSHAKDGGKNSSVVIDLAGDDVYRSEGDFVLGSGFFGGGILVDLSGQDTYLAENFSLGSGLFGVGVLVDEGGEDRYFGDTFTMGAASFGLGVLVDLDGADHYTGALLAQGFGSISGLGALIDSSGNDNYFAGGKYKDILRYEDHYISLSQGFAYGLRPMMSGGIGLLYDLSGHDLYTSDIFGQGSSYWWGLGSLLDEQGNDKYVSFQYAQGVGTHLTLGILEDDSGNDIYISKGVSQGCGHDLALGLLYDRSGNDDYMACDLSQAAGSANGIGMLIDEDGDDGYYVEKKHNTQGYGNPRRDYGSVGILLDLSGKDQYDGNGKDSTWWTIPSKWGVGVDK